MELKEGKLKDLIKTAAQFRASLRTAITLPAIAPYLNYQPPLLLLLIIYHSPFPPNSFRNPALSDLTHRARNSSTKKVEKERELVDDR